MAAHDHLTAFVNILRCKFVALRRPILADYGFVEIPSLKCLIPYDQTLALLLEMSGDAVVEQSLQFLYILEAVLFDGLLAVWAGLPLVLRGFVTADVEIGSGEEGRDFINNIKDKLIGALLARAGGTIPVFPVERFFRNGLSIEPVDLAGNLAAGEIGVSGDRGGKMRRHIDFRHDHDKPLRSVGDDFLDLLLCIEAGRVGLALEPFAFPAVNLCIFALGANLRQQRVFFDFNAPALIVRQVPVEHVELMHRHEIEITLDVVHAPEVAALIEHHAAPAKAGLVFDVDTGDGEPFGVFGCIKPQQLAQRLDCIESAAGGGCDYGYTVLCAVKPVALLRHGRITHKTDIRHLVAGPE